MSMQQMMLASGGTSPIEGVEYTILAGGGGANYSPYHWSSGGGGGGAGGWLENYQGANPVDCPPLTFERGVTYTITVGAGGSSTANGR